MCRKVEGISPTFGYTIELISDHISVFIINHTNHLEREGRLEIESLRRI